MRNSFLIPSVDQSPPPWSSGILSLASISGTRELSSALICNGTDIRCRPRFEWMDPLDHDIAENDPELQVLTTQLAELQKTIQAQREGRQARTHGESAIPDATRRAD